MFGPWLEAWSWVKGGASKKTRFRRPHFNFITLHYIYIIIMVLAGSVILYGAGNLSYVDALLFASGGATQSGLNPVDVNLLFLYQQVYLMLVACITNPIFIHSFVVFVRLYWFEKRFQNVVRDARLLRHVRTRSRTKSQAREDHDPAIEERGVRGRSIRVLHGPNGTLAGSLAAGRDNSRELGETTGKPTGNPIGLENGGISEIEKSLGDTGMNGNTTNVEVSPTLRRDIVFADEVKSSPLSQGPSHQEPAAEPAPQRRTTEQHIAFVENQRNPKAKSTLRIPGPRDFDRGVMPQQVDEDDESPEHHLTDGDGSKQRQAQDLSNGNEDYTDDAPAKLSVIIDEPDHPNRDRSKSTWSRFPFTKTGGSAVPESPTQGLRPRSTTRTFASFVSNRSQERDPMPYLSWQPTIGRNSVFIDLSEEQREELGGIEYRALKTLAFVLVLYFVGFHLFGMVCLLPWIVESEKYSSIVRSVGVNPVWWGFFTPASLFNDLGFSLNPDSLISFQSAVFPILLGSFLILVGNTAFPCMLRFIIWLSSKFVPRGSGIWEEFRFLLDHPRRCFTLLFPSKATWWLFWVLMILNIVDLIFFIILDLDDDTVTSLPPGIRVLDGWFQATATRTAGFSVVNLAELHPAIQVSYLVMMYISVFPIAISIRASNVYEEKSLGLYGSSSDEATSNSYVATHLRRQLSFDIWYVFLGLFIIAIIEGRRIENTNDYAFTMFSILFEVVSAYGTVGLSLGYPGLNTSFCSEFKTLSKLIIIAMEIRGRHRGLPYALDRAILLPSERLLKKEEEIAKRVRRLSNSNDPAVAPDTTNSHHAHHAHHAHPEAAKRWSKAYIVARLISGGLSAGPIYKEKPI